MVQRDLLKQTGLPGHRLTEPFAPTLAQRDEVFLACQLWVPFSLPAVGRQMPRYSKHHTRETSHLVPATFLLAGVSPAEALSRT
jgi:hypothetical protein